jgi:hypothetical protein
LNIDFLICIKSIVLWQNLGKITRFDLFYARYVAFKEMADLGPEASNAFKLPIFEISILKDEKKSPRLSSDFVAWWR